MSTSSAGGHADDADIALDELDGIKDEEALFKKISLVLLPLFFVMVVLCYVDRTNLAFAGVPKKSGIHPRVHRAVTTHSM